MLIEVPNTDRGSIAMLHVAQWTLGMEKDLNEIEGLVIVCDAPLTPADISEQTES